MKRFQKYSAQLQLLQEAAVVIARREGPEALTRRRLSAELGTVDATARRALGEHVLLPTLAANECAARRRRAAHRRTALDRLVPTGDEVDLEVVWLRLLLGYGTVPVIDDGADLPQRYALSVHDRIDDREARAPVEDPRTAERAALASHFSDRVEDDRALVQTLVRTDPDLVDAVHALVDGLVLHVCTGRLSTDAARAVLADHLDRLGAS